MFLERGFSVQIHAREEISKYWAGKVVDMREALKREDRRSDRGVGSAGIVNGILQLDLQIATRRSARDPQSTGGQTGRAWKKGTATGALFLL